MRLRFTIVWSEASLGVERTSKRKLRHEARFAHGYPNPIARARKYEAALDEGGSYADVARQFGVTREEVCQYVTVARRLPSGLVAAIEGSSDPQLLRTLSLARLLRICRARTDGARRVQIREVRTILRDRLQADTAVRSASQTLDRA